MATERRRKEINKKITIVLTNYNAEKYIEESLYSVFNQTYDNIELIITDDGSQNFSKSKIERFIKDNAKENIKNVKFIINKQNIGTVKTVNKALKEITGEYVLFFASDDKLENDNIISDYINTFENNNNINIVVSNWILCDENLNKINYFKKPNFLKKFNKKSAKDIYSTLCVSNIYGAGSMCYRSSIFKKYGAFNENFKYLEDWPLWLNLTKNNEKIYFINKDGLLHRAGGISYNKVVTEPKKEFFKEILYLYREVILKNMDYISNPKKIKILNSYLYNIYYYSNYVDTSEDYVTLKNYVNSNKGVKFCMFLYKIIPSYNLKLNELFNKKPHIPITFIITSIISMILINVLKINLNLFLALILAIYVFVYYVVCTIIPLMDKRGK